jgi:hypothetical protein
MDLAIWCNSSSVPLTELFLGRIRKYLLLLLRLSSYLLQLRLLARDTNVQRLTSTSTVVITVERNLYSPGFLKGDRTVKMNINESPGYIVDKVAATDKDQVSHLGPIHKWRLTLNKGPRFL